MNIVWTVPTNREIAELVIVTIIILSLVIAGLMWLVSEQAKSMAQMERMCSVEREGMNKRFLGELANKDEQYRAVVQSYTINTGKVWVTPVSRFDEHEKPYATTPVPSKRMFKIKPPPPMIRNSNSGGSGPSISQAPVPEVQGAHKPKPKL